MSEEQAKIFAKVFQWAWANDIEIRLFRERSWYPSMDTATLQFSKGDKHVRRMFRELTYVGPEMHHAWRYIAEQLCVHPLELEKPFEKLKKGQPNARG